MQSIELEKVWTDTLGIIKKQLNGPTFKTWFANTKPINLEDGRLTISAPNDFAREWLESRYSSLISGSLLEVLGRQVDIDFVTTEVAEEAEPEAVLTEKPPGPTLPAEERRDRTAKYSFDSFVIGGSNRFAHAAALAVSEKPSRAYNPLFIYGSAGLGKTHLLQAIDHYVNQHHRHLKVKYVSSEKFTNDFINSIRDKDKIVGFQKRYRDNDILLIDDIQFLENKEATQEEFFHTFNTLYEAGKQIVISSDRPPKGIATLEDRLRTRFESGLTVDVQPPDIETRIAILRKQVRDKGLRVPDEVLEYIASRIQSNIRELEGALTRVTAYASLTKSEVTLKMAEETLVDLFPTNAGRPVTIDLIQNEICRYYKISFVELNSKKRSRYVVIPRQVAMYLTRDLTDLSLPKIGALFGGRDHTTVIHAVNKIEKEINEQPEIYNQIQELTNRIKQRCI